MTSGTERPEEAGQTFEELTVLALDTLNDVLGIAERDESFSGDLLYDIRARCVELESWLDEYRQAAASEPRDTER